MVYTMQIGLKLEAGDCPTLNMNAMENYLLSHSLKSEILPCDMYKCTEDYVVVY